MAALTYWVVGPLRSYTPEGWVDNNYSNAVVENGGGVIGTSAWHGYVGGTFDLGIVSNATDVLGMNVVSGMEGVGESVNCVCVRLGVGGEWGVSG